MNDSDTSGIPVREPETPPLLSLSQQRLWYLDQLEPALTAYNMARAYRFHGPLDVDALKRGLDEIVRRHEILRTTFQVEVDVPVQRIESASGFALSIVDVTDDDRERRVGSIIEAERSTAFDLALGPLIKGTLVRLREDEHVLVLVVHHIIFDGWSFGVLFRELMALYDAFRERGTSPLMEPAIQYLDYALWERTQQNEKKSVTGLEYWRRQLAGPLPPLQLPAYRPRPVAQTFNGADLNRRLPPTLLDALYALQRREGVTPFILLLAAFKVLLFRYTGQSDVVVGSPSANRTRPELEELIGFFVNNLVLRTDLSGDPTFRDALSRVRRVCFDAYKHQDTAFDRLVEKIRPERDLSRSPFFQVMFDVQGQPTVPELTGIDVVPVPVSRNTSHFDLSVSICADPQAFEITLNFNTDLFNRSQMADFLSHLQVLLEGVCSDPDLKISRLPLMTEKERSHILVDWNTTGADYPKDRCLPSVFEAQAERTPDAIALVFKNEALSYDELNRRANQLACVLRRRRVGPDVLVGICLERSLEMVVALLAVLKAGGAYVPIDPTYPRKRVDFMLGDARVSMLLTQSRFTNTFDDLDVDMIAIDSEWEALEAEPDENPANDVTPENLAYVIYTSGSTGEPKGVMVSHRNVMNFLSGMDQRVGMSERGVWLAVTSISFDISVLELLWTLGRGFKVVLQPDEDFTRARTRPRYQYGPIDVSLFYFAANEQEAGGDIYRLLLEGAKFADGRGFHAVWTPERHFHEFGGLYPSPSVVSAALAMVTRNLQLRAGSVVLPLHDPIRVVEEWSVVDHLSNGRVGVSFASGWHDRDFVFAPDSYDQRWELMFRDIDTVRRLWRGEEISRRSGRGDDTVVSIHPLPVQSELPVWVTAAGSAGTFERAGTIGANMLTHLLGQSVESLGEKIEIYRSARNRAGHSGRGKVTLMLHAFIDPDEDAVRETVRVPFTRYLRSAVDLIAKLAEGRGQNIRDASFTESDMAALMEHAFERYFESSALFGTPSRCMAMIDELQRIGVDEIACLIDFGVDTDAVLASLERIAELIENRKATPREASYSIAEQIRRHRVTHLQCTPSLASMLVATKDDRNALAGLEKLMVGGEACPASLANELRNLTSAEILNMYGPTETTIWSSTHQLTGAEERSVPIGFPILNTQFYVVGPGDEPVPLGIAGELLIGGEGVVRGYLNRSELTRSRFVPNPFDPSRNSRLYRTGDLVRRLPDGNIEFLGRIDNQVKIRGHRIELGEIEAALAKMPSIQEAVVVVRDEPADDRRLVAYFTVSGDSSPPATELGAWVRNRLPDFMVPAHFVELDAMPLTPNGKIDRRALPAPDVARPTLSNDFVPPQTAVEKAVAGLWSELLGVERLGIHDDFFELGGHSLSAVQLGLRLRQVFQVDLPMFDLFAAPTIASLAALLIQKEPQKGQTENIARILARVESMSDEEATLLLERRNPEKET